jgi:hypothetical protein
MKHEVRVICRKCDEAQIVYCHYKHMRELTDEEIVELHRQFRLFDSVYTTIKLARAIQKKVNEK